MNDINEDSEKSKNCINIADIINLCPIKLLSQKETWRSNLKDMYPSKRPNIIATSNTGRNDVDVICINKKNFEKFQDKVSTEIKNLEKKLEELEKQKITEIRKIKMLYESDFIPNEKFEASAKVVKMVKKKKLTKIKKKVMMVRVKETVPSVLIELEKFEELDTALQAIIEKTGKLNFVNTLNDTYIMNFKNRWYRKRMELALVTNDENECFVMIPITRLEKLENELRDVFDKVEDEIRMAALIARKNEVFSVRETEKMEEEKIKIKREIKKLELEKEKFYKDKIALGQIIKQFEDISFMFNDIGLKKIHENLNIMKNQVLESLNDLDKLDDFFKNDELDCHNLIHYETQNEFNIKSFSEKSFLYENDSNGNEEFLGVISLMENLVLK